tara:strand:+ start:216 stop:2759 length:2544 start_codon:yes stop_codon:yes gene_type:complete
MNLLLPFFIGIASLLVDSELALAKEQTIEEITVVGSPIRASQQSAIEAKRNASNILEVISADAIGRFPDQNLAESLSRVPGLAVERDQGQARYLNFRGAPQRYTPIAFDGIDVPGAENGRIPRFDSFPSTITSRVIAHKAITPDMPGGAVAGLIDIQTFNPLDKEGSHFSVEAGIGEQDLGGGDVQRFNGRFSFSNDRFGFVGFASQNSRDQVTDNREYGLDFSQGSAQIETVEFRNYIVEREDSAYGARIEFRREGSSLSRAFFSTLYSEFLDNESRHDHIFDFLGSTAEVGSAGNGLFLGGQRLGYGEYENSTFVNTLGADLVAGNWEVEVRYNYTETENKTFLPVPNRAAGFADAGAGLPLAGAFDFSNMQDPSLTLSNPATGAPLNVSDIQYAATLAFLVDEKMENEVNKFKVDASLDTELFNRFSTLKVGIQYESRRADGYPFTFTLDFGYAGFVDLESNETGEPWASDFNNSVGGIYFDNPALTRLYGQGRGGFDFEIDPENLVSIEEDITALYAMATTEFAWGSLTYGVRIEMTDFSSSGNVVNAENDAVLSIIRGKDYEDILPSIHANVDLTDDLKLRASLSTGISRPTYEEARASISVSPISFDVTGGNPDLDAESALGIDLSLEYYFAPGSIFSATAFTRSIDNVIYAGTTTIEDGSVLAPGIIDPGTSTRLTSFINGKNGQLTGLELSFTGRADNVFPAPFDGFGISGNFTVLDGEFDTIAGNTSSLPGTSDLIYGGSIFYEKYGLSARINYQFRDAWLTTTEDTGGGQYWDEQERVDFSVRYLLPLGGEDLQATVFANLNNLTDSVDVRYRGTAVSPDQVEGYGRRYLIGVRIDY